MEDWFSKGLKAWYLQNKRDLPWRNTRDPYKIWLSEIILQQTQVAQGLAYYERFVAQYPKVQNLASASENQVLKLWQGLGYYSRARNLHTAAKEIVSQKGGLFPQTYQEILKLKGVGSYTAAAIASFAFNEPKAVLDGNVYRLLSRLFGIYTPIDSTAGKKQFQELADLLLNRKQAALHNQAIMEFGSQVCKPTKPDCLNCIFRSHCAALKNKVVEALPVKAKKTAVRNRYFNYLIVIGQKKNILVKKRGPKDIWQGLYEFILSETEHKVKLTPSKIKQVLAPLSAAKVTILQQSAEFKHILSHQHLYVTFNVVDAEIKSNGDYKQISYKQLLKLPVPQLIEKFLKGSDLQELF